ncbi:hypothetical protein ACGF3G_04965 [Streptomyces sp. NPDC048179]|uniref:hypothetical protein n=1 Tax=Streptomyces sp. NPDC048179 TaxID=3365506 RepID=UPI00371FDD5C
MADRATFRPRIVMMNVDASLSMSHQGQSIARFRLGRIVWWLALGWAVADPYTSLTGRGVGALVCIVALGTALGMLGSLAALCGAATMGAAGTPTLDLLWWVLPLLGGWCLGAASDSTARISIVDTWAFAVIAVPAIGLLATIRSWFAVVVFLALLVLLVLPHLKFIQETAGATRFNRIELRLGAVIGVLSTTLLALSTAGDWFVASWPHGGLGLVVGTACTAAAMITTKAVFLLVMRSSLASAHRTRGPAQFRVNRDQFSGLYGAEIGIGWFCVLASGVFHDSRQAFLGSTVALALSFTRPVVRRIEIPLRYTVERLDAALYLFSQGRRRRELQAAWLADSRKILSTFALDEQHDGSEPAHASSQAARRLQKTRDNARHIAIGTAYELVEAMLDESKKTAYGDVDDTMWLPFTHKEGRPQLLNVSLQWNDAAKELLDAAAKNGFPAMSTPGTLLHTAHQAYRCYCRNVRGTVHGLHGRLEEAIADHYAAARICRSIGAVNTEAAMLSNGLSVFPGVPVRSDVSATRMQRIDATLHRIVRSDQLHPQIRRQLAIDVACQRLTSGDRESAESLVRLAADIPLPQPGWTTLGIESVQVTDQTAVIHLGATHYHFPLNHVDYTAFLDGTADFDAFLSLEYVPSPGLIHHLGGALPEYSKVARKMTMKPRTTGVPGTRVEISDFRVLEAWILRTESRAGSGLTAHLREILGLALRATDPYRAAHHLVGALAHRQSVHFAILDDDLRTAVRGAAETFADITVDHLAALATSPQAVQTEPSVATVAFDIVGSVKSRALTELLGDAVPAPSDGDSLIAREQEARQRYDGARSARDRARTRDAREELEHCWSELMATEGPAAEYASLRAGLPLEYDGLRALLRRLSVTPDIPPDQSRGVPH